MESTPLAIETEGLVKVLRRDAGPSTASTSPSGRAPSTACSARTAPARPRPSACWPRCSGPTAGTARVLGHDVVTEADAVRGCVSLTGQFASVDEELSGRENLVLLGRLLGLDPARGPGAGRRAARRLRADRGRRPAGQGVLRRHAPPARHRRQHRRHPRAAVPRRADHRPRPPQPQPGVGHRPGPRRRGHDRAAHDAVPRRGRPARRPHRHHRPRQGHRRGHQRRAEGARRRGHAPRPGASTPSSGPQAARGAGRRRSASPVQLESDPAVAVGPRLGPRAGRRRPHRAVPRRDRRRRASRSASPASTRCSSPSPATRPERAATTTEDAA